MMGQKKPDLSSKSNVAAIRTLLPGVGVEMVPFLGENAAKVTNVKQNGKKMKKTLAGILGDANLYTVPSNRKSDCSTKTVATR